MARITRSGKIAQMREALKKRLAARAKTAATTAQKVVNTVKVNTDKFEQEYQAFIAGLKAKKAEAEKAAVQVQEIVETVKEVAPEVKEQVAEVVETVAPVVEEVKEVVEEVKTKKSKKSKKTEETTEETKSEEV